MRVGMICRMDKSGLGQGQTLRLAKLLNPAKVMLIDSTSFNGNEQFPAWYKDYQSIIINGFPNDEQVRVFLQDLDVVISCETFYNNSFVHIARRSGVKTILIANYEFFDWHKTIWLSMPLPNQIVLPSQWNIEKMERYKPIYLPTPIFLEEFKHARQVNLKRKGQRKYLFINGKTAVHDRNGLESLYESLQLSKGDYTVTVKSQSDAKKHPDPRIIYDFSNPIDQEELYKDFDALILPRRYGGQSLTMNEALMSALPVVMTDIDPQDMILPGEWLVDALPVSQFMARTSIDVFDANPIQLAEVLDTLDVSVEAKEQAFMLGMQFEAESLRSKYEELLS